MWSRTKQQFLCGSGYLLRKSWQICSGCLVRKIWMGFEVSEAQHYLLCKLTRKSSAAQLLGISALNFIETSFVMALNRQWILTAFEYETSIVQLHFHPPLASSTFEANEKKLMNPTTFTFDFYNDCGWACMSFAKKTMKLVFKIVAWLAGSLSQFSRIAAMVPLSTDWNRNCPALSFSKN